MPSSRLQPAQQLQDLRLHRHVQRRGRLVGDQQVGLAQRAPWRSSPAGACRPRTRADTCRTAAPAPGCRPAPASAMPRRRASASSMPLCRVSTSVIWSRDPHGRVERGHRVLEDHRDIGRRGSRSAPGAADSGSRCRGSARGRSRGRCCASRPMIDEEDLALARAALADHAQALAGSDGEAHVVGGQHLAVGRGKAAWTGRWTSRTAVISRFHRRAVSDPSGRARRAARRR